MDLMAYADGELAGEDKARVEAWLETSEEARRALGAMESPAVGEWLSREMEARAARGGADGIADAVMLKAAAPERGGKVVPMRRRGMVGGAIVGVLALAAAGLLYVKTHDGGSKSLVAQATTAPGASTAPAAPEAEGAGIEVNEVEAPARDVSVYYLDQPQSTNTSVVIWIGDEKQHGAGGN
jgi:anti-sigma factor RsiW